MVSSRLRMPKKQQFSGLFRDFPNRQRLALRAFYVDSISNTKASCILRYVGKHERRSNQICNTGQNMQYGLIPKLELQCTEATWKIASVSSLPLLRISNGLLPGLPQRRTFRFWVEVLLVTKITDSQDYAPPTIKLSFSEATGCGKSWALEDFFNVRRIDFSNLSAHEYFWYDYMGEWPDSEDLLYEGYGDDAVRLSAKDPTPQDHYQGQFSKLKRKNRIIHNDDGACFGFAHRRTFGGKTLRVFPCTARSVSIEGNARSVEIMVCPFQPYSNNKDLHAHFVQGDAVSIWLETPLFTLTNANLKIQEDPRAESIRFYCALAIATEETKDKNDSFLPVISYMPRVSNRFQIVNSSPDLELTPYLHLDAPLWRSADQGLVFKGKGIIPQQTNKCMVLARFDLSVRDTLLASEKLRLDFVLGIILAISIKFLTDSFGLSSSEKVPLGIILILVAITGHLLNHWSGRLGFSRSAWRRLSLPRRLD